MGLFELDPDRVALRKISSGTDRRTYEAMIVDQIIVGRPMVLFYAGRRIVTTPVQRVLSAVGDARQFVATENSVYELRPLR
jgi:hypothetical protein